MDKKKIAIVNQRYGIDVNGGSEYYARALAEHLVKRYDVEVITTCARDYDTWENYYEEGVTELNGVLVRRFPVKRTRSRPKFKLLDRVRKYSPVFTRGMEQKWIEEQGPYSPECIQYIEANEERYDGFIFITYLYYLTAVGLKKVAHKSILIPTVHDEPFLKMKLYQELFHLPRGFFFNTEEERELVYRKFGTENIPDAIGGIGIDVLDNTDGESFRKKYGLCRYILYVGRIDYGKNCNQLFRYFSKYQKKNRSPVKLVLMGKEMIEVPKRKDIISLGFVSEEEKYNGMSGAEFLVLPSEYESLSIVVLDSMKLGVPVIVNGRCKVLKAHCEKSRGGLYYRNYNEFKRAMDFLLYNKKDRETMGDNGKKYVEKNYQWDTILKSLEDLMEKCF